MVRLTPYAEDKLARRGLSREVVERVTEEPGQLFEEGRRRVAQSRYTDVATGKEYLLRVIYEPSGQDKVVITAYQTSKIAKYWRSA